MNPNPRQDVLDVDDVLFSLYAKDLVFEEYKPFNEVFEEEYSHLPRKEAVLKAVLDLAVCVYEDLGLGEALGYGDESPLTEGEREAILDGIDLQVTAELDGETVTTIVEL